MGELSLSKDRIHVVLLEGIHDEAVETLARAGYNKVTVEKTSLSGEALRETLATAHFLGIRSRTQLTAEVLQAAPKLNAVGCFCIGTNQVDLDAAASLGIPVFNAPFSNTRSVAELVIAEIIMLMRGIPQRNAAAHRGQWLKTATGSHEIRGKSLGIIGYGHIGTQLGVLAEGLGMRVTYYDIEDKLPLGNAQMCPSLASLLAESDVISLHVPQTDETQNMIGEAEIDAMKPGAFVINASRGNVVEIDALSKALQSGHVGGAAIDVFPREPKSNEEEFVSPLRGMDNVLITPHVGGSTQEAQVNIAREVASKLVRYSDNGSTVSAVNFPEVTMPDVTGRGRILHIHENVPGVLERINRIFSDKKVNIAGQYLQTRGNIGYVVMDIDSVAADGLLEALNAIPGTIRSRILF